jgi:periplasmic protein TonB
MNSSANNPAKYFLLLGLSASFIAHGAVAVWVLMRPPLPEDAVQVPEVQSYIEIIELAQLETAVLQPVSEPEPISEPAPIPKPKPTPEPKKPKNDVAPDKAAPVPVVSLASEVAQKTEEKPVAVIKPKALPETQPARYEAAYLNNPPPVYPRISKRLREQGTVLLRVQVDAQGRAITVDVSESSGFARLDDAAQEAVRQWRFIPAQRGGEAISAAVLVPIEFKLGA